MTDQNFAYRNDPDPSAEEDPLAELARIVAGEPEPAKPQKPLEVAIEPAEAAEAPSEFDIEAELMRELGDAEPGNIAAPAAEIEQPEAPSAPEETFVPEMPPRSQATPVASQAHYDEETSLEDQLMAELSNEDFDQTSGSIAEPDPVQPRLATDPLDQVEDVAAGLKAEYQEEAEVSSPPAAAPLEQAGETEDLDDFFADGFSDLLEEDIAPEPAPKPKSLATPQLATPQMATTEPTEEIAMDDLESHFSEAFEAELELESQPVAKLEIETEPDLEADFAKAFDEQLLAQGIGATAAVGVAAAANAPSPQASRYQEPLLDDPAFDDFEDERMAAAPLTPKPSRNGFKLAVGALCAALVVGLGVVGWGAMNGDTASTGNEPTIIKADTDPVKVKPEEPGGKKIENQDNQVYTKVAGTQVEEKVQEELISSREQVSEDAKATNRLAPKEEPAQKQQATLGISPKKVRTLTVKPDGTIVQSEPETPTVAPAVETAAKTETAVASQTETASAAESVLPSIDGATSTGAIAVPTPSPLPAPEQAVQVAAAPTPKPAATPAPQPTASAPAPTPAAADPNAPTQIANLDQSPAPTPKVTSSEWKVQVSSQRSREAAEASFNNIQNRFGSVLSGRSANIEKADVDGKGTFYRVKILADSKASAGELCTRLKSAGGSCFVTR